MKAWAFVGVAAAVLSGCGGGGGSSSTPPPAATTSPLDAYTVTASGSSWVVDGVFTKK